jgi:stringent starvation protein B
MEVGHKLKVEINMVNAIYAKENVQGIYVKINFHIAPLFSGKNS